MSNVYLNVLGRNGETAVVVVNYVDNLWISGSKYFGKSNGGSLSWFELTTDRYGQFWEWMDDDWHYVATLEGMPLHQSTFYTEGKRERLEDYPTAWVYRRLAAMRSPLFWTPRDY